MTAAPERLTILGATGATGKLVILEALEAGYAVTVYVRDRSKLPLDVTSRVRIVEGGLGHRDREKVAEALEGSQAVISALGPRFANRTVASTPIGDFFRDILIPLMQEQGIKRILVVSAMSWPDPNDKPSIYWWLMIWVVRIVAGFAYRDVVALSRAIADSPLDYTLVRVPNLTNKRGHYLQVHVGYAGDRKDPGSLSREAAARWMVGEVERNEWVRRAPKLGDA